jgi:hypothetical protein
MITASSADVGLAAWAVVDGFYSNLARSVAMARPAGHGGDV